MDLDIFYCLHCLVMLNIVLILYGRILIKAGHFCCLFKSWQYFSLSDREIFSQCNQCMKTDLTSSADTFWVKSKLPITVSQCNQCMKTDLTSSADTFWVKSKLPITVLLSCSKPRRSNNNKYAFHQDAYRPLVDRIGGGGGLPNPGVGGMHRGRGVSPTREGRSAWAGGRPPPPCEQNGTQV